MVLRKQQHKQHQQHEHHHHYHHRGSDEDMMMTMMNNTTTTFQPKLYKNLISFIRPWLSIVIISCLATVYYSGDMGVEQHPTMYDDIIVSSANDYDQYWSDEQQHYQSSNERHNQRQDERSLMNDSEDYIPTVQIKRSKSKSSSTTTMQTEPGTTDKFPPQRERKHKPVFNEEHKPLFPLSTSDYYGLWFSIVGLILAAGGGIGGGGILVPIYILVMGFSPKHAIPLSNITVLGGSFANTVLNVPKRHPLADRPLIDWDLILVMEPITLGAALVGAILNKVLPELLITIMLVILLAFTAYTTLQKAMKMYKQETKNMIAAKESELTKLENNHDLSIHVEAENGLLKNMEKVSNDDDDDDDDDDRKPAASTTSTAGATFVGDVDTTISTPSGAGIASLEALKQKNYELAEILQEEQTTPAFNIRILTALFTVVLTVNVLKGGGAFPSPLGITCGSKSFWFSNLFIVAWIFGIMFFVRQYLVSRYHKKKACQYPYVIGDIQWDEKNTIVFPCICCFAGFFAGMFGIGGGIVKGPLMLAMGVHPAVSAATSATMIFFTAIAATTSFVVFGLLIYDYAILLMIVGFVATVVGQLGLNYLMKKANRNSYIAFSIGLVVLISAFLMTIQSVLSLAEGEKHHSGGLCGKGD